LHGLNKVAEYSHFERSIMVDVFDKQKRSWLMSRVKGKDTKPDLIEPPAEDRDWPMAAEAPPEYGRSF